MSHQSKIGNKDVALKLAFFSAVGISLPAVVMPLMTNPSMAIVGVIMVKFFVAMPLIAGTTRGQNGGPQSNARTVHGDVFRICRPDRCQPWPSNARLHQYIYFLLKPAGTLGYALSISAALTIPFSTTLLWISWSEYKKHVSKDE